MMAAVQEDPRARALLFNNVPNTRDVKRDYIDKLWTEFGIEVVRVIRPDNGVNFAIDNTIDLYIACINCLGHPQYNLLKPLAKMHGKPLILIERQSSGWTKALKMDPLPKVVQQVLLTVVPDPPPSAPQVHVPLPVEVPLLKAATEDVAALAQLYEEDNEGLKKKVAELVKKREMQAGTMAAQTKTIKRLEARIAELEVNPGNVPLSTGGDLQKELEKRRAVLVEREARIRELVDEVADFDKRVKELQHQLKLNPGYVELQNKTKQIQELQAKLNAATTEVEASRKLTRQIQDRAREHFQGATAADAHLTKMLISLQNNVAEGILTAEEALDRLMKKMVKEGT